MGWSISRGVRVTGPRWCTALETAPATEVEALRVEAKAEEPPSEETTEFSSRPVTAEGQGTADSHGRSLGESLHRASLHCLASHPGEKDPAEAGCVRCECLRSRCDCDAMFQANMMYPKVDRFVKTAVVVNIRSYFHVHNWDVRHGYFRWGQAQPYAGPDTSNTCPKPRSAAASDAGACWSLCLDLGQSRFPAKTWSKYEFCVSRNWAEHCSCISCSNAGQNLSGSRIAII